MTMSRSEIDFLRLLAASEQQQNQAKLMHYVATLTEQLEQLAEENTPAGFPRVSKETLKEYSEKIEVIASKLAVIESNGEEEIEELPVVASANQSPIESEDISPRTNGLRRRIVFQSTSEDKSHDGIQADQSSPVKLDAAARSHIQEQRCLHEDLTGDLVGLLRQLKERNLLLNQSMQSTEKHLDSTGKEIEHSLAGTGHATSRAMEIHSSSSKTTCCQWLLVFFMSMVFLMVVHLIRLTS